MSFLSSNADAPVRHLSVFRGADMCVTHGVNEGDPLTDAAELVLEDVYELAPTARPLRLAIVADEAAGAFRISPATEVGRPGTPLYLDSLLTFMRPSGETREALVFVEVDAQSGTIAEVYLHPLAPIGVKTGCTLVTIDREQARSRLAATASVAFTRGTRITMAGGRQVPIEEIRPGDRVLTRDSGVQVVRWTGLQTLRASGAFAPITIAAGTLNNTGDLVVSPNHRLFVYQRIDALRAGRKEVLVRADLLVNGTSVTREEGGFVDYFQILFDKHEIIYAEGIAAESLFVDTTTTPALPEAVRQRLASSAASRPVPGHELREADLKKGTNAAELLRRASTL